MEKQKVKDFLLAYSKGRRYFSNLEFDENESVRGANLSEVFFENCFLFLDFTDVKLKGAKFIGCNIKTADFSNSDLTNAIIKNCSVESITFKGAKTENLTFEENHCYGNIVGQKDFESFFRKQ
jgi:uncharacterized protein YjbI with pentapeptide repeats